MKAVFSALAAPSRFLSIAVLVSLAGTASAEYERGLSQYEQGNYERALMEFRTDANIGHTQAMRKLGEMYLAGEGVDSPDLIQAVKWLTLAYLQGDTELVATLETIREDISESQLVAGEQAALQWLEDAMLSDFGRDDVSELYETF
jgi:TPR repeat protein